MSAAILLPNLETAMAALQAHVKSRLEEFRIAAKYIPSTPVPGGPGAMSVPWYRVRPDHSVDQVAQRELVRLEVGFSLPEENVREPNLPAARAKLDRVVRDFGRYEDDILVNGNATTTPNQYLIRPPQDDHFWGACLVPPLVAGRRAPEDYVDTILRAGSRLMNRIRPKSIVLLVESEMFDELNRLMPPHFMQSPLDHVERAERLRISLIRNSDALPSRSALMLAVEGENAPSSGSESGGHYLIDRPVGIEPELQWAGWRAGHVLFRLVDTFALRIKDPSAFEILSF